MNPISNTRRLRGPVEQALPELIAATTAVVTHPGFRELCVDFLVTIHQMIRASVPLMRAALQRCRELEGTDPVAAAMAPYLAQHIKEETHHDDWLLEDLELLGVPREQVLRRMPSSAVASLIGAHYYWIYHHHPVAKLGQIAVMEGYPPSLGMIDLLVERTGFPRKAFRTMEKHCHLDTHHRDEFNDALDAMPLRDEHHAILEASALHTVRSAAKVYRELVDEFEKAKGQATGPAARGALVPARRPDLVTRRLGNNGDYRLEDTLSGAVYRLGEQENFLLNQCDGRTSAKAVRRAFAEHFGQPLSEEELDEFLRMAGEEHLIAGAPFDGAAHAGRRAPGRH